VIVRRVQKWAARTDTSLDDTIVEILLSTRMLFVSLVALQMGVLFLVLPAGTTRYTRIAAVIALLLQIGVWANAAITAAIRRENQKKAAAGDTSGVSVMAMLGVLGRSLAWAVVVLLILDNLGVNITALVAGLGIGGIAIALAVQSVLQDLLASVSIVLDKPFEIGDTIHVDDLIGTVQHIGIKTTRLRALSGEQLVFGNKDLLGARVRNYKRMEERRAVFAVGVSYETPVDTLEKLPELLRQVVEREDRTRFDRAHFKTFGPSSLDFEIVYYVLVPDYAEYMSVQQRINFEILRRFHALGVTIAYPTQTIHLHQAQPPRPAPRTA
jgi:small-conductance mechanosensitive channel